MHRKKKIATTSDQKSRLLYSDKCTNKQKYLQPTKNQLAINQCVWFILVSLYRHICSFLGGENFRNFMESYLDSRYVRHCGWLLPPARLSGNRQILQPAIYAISTYIEIDLWFWEATVAREAQTLIYAGSGRLLRSQYVDIQRCQRTSQRLSMIPRQI